MSDVLFESNIPELPLIARGKVRDLYNVDDQHLLIVTTDRLSAFDVILPTGIPRKGEVLTRISRFWFERLSSIVPNHLAHTPLSEVIHDEALCASLEPRSMLVRKLKPLPIEAIVRGYLIGSGWKDYQASGQVCGIALPSGLSLAERLPETLFTPSTKAEVGDHDINVSFDETVKLLGQERADQVRQISIQLYEAASEYAKERGIIIADTKFEFGEDVDGNLVLIDEALTPDSSRFWPAESYQPGISPPSFDKQFVRDYLDTLDWNKTAPGPDLPQDIVEKTSNKYSDALNRLTSL